jgi:hypothetical protein
LLTYCGHERADDGSFLIAFEDYLKFFGVTCFSVEWNPQKYTKSVFMHDFVDSCVLNCKFELDSEINTRDEVFAISVT